MSNPKEVRKQLRNVVQEILPEMLTQEFARKLHDELLSELMARLDSVEKQIREALAAIDQRSKEMQAYTMRQIAANTGTPMPMEIPAAIEAPEDEVEASI